MADVAFGRYRTTPQTVWRPARSGPFAPTYELDEGVFEDLRAIERADQDLRRFRVDDATARRILEDALTRNAYGTASIEGNPMTLEEVESLLARGPTPDALERPEEREILNYVAFVRGLDSWGPPRSADDVLRLHRTLFDGVLPDSGEFKKQPNFIGRRPQYEVVFVPAMPERVAPELASALAWMQDAAEHPLVKVIVAFHEFQGIHPFRDGNGRAGRALATLLLHQLGYAGVRYALVDYEFNNDRDNYYANLSAVERNGWDFSPWVAYMARVLREGFEGAVQRFLFRDGLPDGLNERQVQVAEWCARLVRDNPERRVKFNDRDGGAGPPSRPRKIRFRDVHAAFPAVADRTLKRDLATLRDAGVLRQDGERKGTTYRLAG